MNKKHIHWLLPGSFNDIQTVKNHILASIRLRTYVSTLNSKNFTFTFGENMPIETDVLVIGKIGNFDLKKRSLNWFDQIKLASISKRKVILDYTDNHLMMNSPFTNFYKAILPYISTVITPSEKMSYLFSNFWRGQIITIYDSIEIDNIPWRDKTGKKILWFGHATNINYLLDFVQNNFSLIKNHSLNIISNQIGIDYFMKHNDNKLDLKTRLWSKETLIKESLSCDICIIPSNKESIRKQGVGHNRLITAFALGMPTIATSLPSYSIFEDYFIDIESKEKIKILDNPNILKPSLIQAQKNIVPLFKNKTLCKKWQKIFNF
jgi:hypothetical protein